MNVLTKPTAIVVDVARITPDTARAMLTTSKGNRSLKSAKVESLVRDIQRGKFALNGESIIVSDSGNLLDGHHRLTACVKANSAIWSVVVRGIPEAAGKTQDTGASRTSGDHLSLSGYPNSNNLSAVICCILSAEKGRPRSANPSTTEVFDFIEANPDIHESAKFAATKAYPRAGNILGAIYFAACRNGEREVAQRFKEVFATGVPAYSGCPAHLLRERLNKQALKGEKLPLQMVHRLFAAAWEKFRIGKPAKTLKAPTEYVITGISG